MYCVLYKYFLIYLLDAPDFLRNMLFAHNFLGAALPALPRFRTPGERMDKTDKDDTRPGAGRKGEAGPDAMRNREDTRPDSECKERAGPDTM